MDSTLQYFVSAREGDLSRVASLLENGIEINSENAGGATALEMASESGQVEMVRFLIAHGARIDPVETLCFSSALITSSTYHHAEIVRLLLQNGADPNISDREGQTALMWAAFHDAPLEIIEAIVSSGADLTQTDDNGNTALDYAADAGHKRIVEFLRRTTN